MFSPADRSQALRALGQLSVAPKYRPSHQLARKDFWPEWFADLSEEDRRKAAWVSGESEGIYFAWIAFDTAFADRRPLAAVLLDTRPHRLTPGARSYLRRALASHLGPYEVVEVRLEEGLRMRDLWTDRVVWIRERRGTRQLARWDVLAARLVEEADGSYVMEGPVLAFPPYAADGILSELRRAHRAFSRRHPAGDAAAFFKRIGPLLHELWLEEVVLRPEPRFVTPEGDQVVFARVTFEVKDPGRLAEQLTGHPELVQNDDSTYAWLETAGSEDTPRRSLGTLSIEGNHLVLEAISTQRAERGRRMLEERAGDAVRFLSAEHTDAAEAMRQIKAEAARGTSVPEPTPAIPPELEAEALGKYYEEHYRAWPDTPLPALGNRTPRRAARLKTWRPRVIALLKMLENHSERLRREGRPAYDFSWMWDELGLDRP